MGEKEPQYLSVAEAALRAGSHRQTILEAIWAGDLVAHQRGKGGHWKIRPEAVTAWVEGTPAEAEAA